MRFKSLLAVIVAACAFNLAVAQSASAGGDILESERLENDVYGPECKNCPVIAAAAPAPQPVPVATPVPDQTAPVVTGPEPVTGGAPAPVAVTRPANPSVIRLGGSVGVAPGLTPVTSGVIDDQEHAFLPVADATLGAYLALGGTAAIWPYADVHGYVARGSARSESWAVGMTFGGAVNDFLTLGVGGEIGQKDLDIDPNGYTARQDNFGVGPQVVLSFSDPNSMLDLGLDLGGRVNWAHVQDVVSGDEMRSLGFGGLVAFRTGIRF